MCFSKKAICSALGDPAGTFLSPAWAAAAVSTKYAQTSARRICRIIALFLVVANSCAVFRGWSANQYMRWEIGIPPLRDSRVVDQGLRQEERLQQMEKSV